MEWIVGLIDARRPSLGGRRSTGSEQHEFSWGGASGRPLPVSGRLSVWDSSPPHTFGQVLHMIRILVALLDLLMLPGMREFQRALRRLADRLTNAVQSRG